MRLKPLRGCEFTNNLNKYLDGRTLKVGRYDKDEDTTYYGECVQSYSPKDVIEKWVSRNFGFRKTATKSFLHLGFLETTTSWGISPFDFLQSKFKITFKLSNPQLCMVLRIFVFVQKRGH